MTVSSILDNDAYKLSMGNMVLRLFPRLNVRYELINRGGAKFPRGFAGSLISDLNGLSRLSLLGSEQSFLLKHCPHLDPAFIDFFKGYRYNPREVSVSQNGGDLKVTIEGPWYRTIFWEVLLMATISEKYCAYATPISHEERKKKVLEKRDIIRDLGVFVADFGTRRRFSLDNHSAVVYLLKDVLVGTSNLHLAMVHGLKPIGTIAHEAIQAHGALYGFKMANRMAMENWVKIFRGDLGIALSDTYTTDVFLRSFDKKFAKLFDGVRQDSGDPVEQAEKIVEHYESIGIDPITKTIVFSDNLNLDRVDIIHEWCKGKIRDAYGIGTFLTNDVGVKPLNFVIKLVAVELNDGWASTVKLSDTTGKHTGNPRMIELCKAILDIEP